MKGISYLSVYSNDTFDPEYQGNVTWCEHLQKFVPTAQKQLLDLWTELGIPFKEHKQMSGPILMIIGIEFNVNKMTLTLPQDAWTSLISKIDDFIGHSPQNLRHSLRCWQ